MPMFLRISSALATVAIAMTLTQSNVAKADTNMSTEAELTQDFDFSTLNANEADQSSNELMMLDAQFRPGGPGGPGGGGPGRPGDGPGRPGDGPGRPGDGPGRGGDGRGGHGGPGHGGPGWGRRVQCVAYNMRGQAFVGEGRDFRAAQQNALDYCYQYSRRCSVSPRDCR